MVHYLAYETPQFSDTDPLVCRYMQLRPSEWAVVFDWLGKLEFPSMWFQADPVHATVSEVTAEFGAANFLLPIEVCIMIGQVIELELNAPPAWVLRCDGATYARVDYPELYAAIHPGLVLDADHFRVPDRVRRLGMDGLYIGMQEGEETHTLTVAEFPPHHHTDNEPAPEASVVLGVLSGVGIGSAASVTGDTGGGGAHNNMQPTEGTAFYIVARWPQAGD